MRTAKKIADNKSVLQDLVPLNALSDERFNEISEKIVIEVVKSGRYVFRNGDRDNRTVYLLEGKLDLIDENRKVTGEIVAGSDASRHPFINQQPRPLSARANGKAVIAWIDSGLLDVFLTWDQSNTADALELEVEDSGDWMTRLLKSETFRKLPPYKLQGVLVRMKAVPVRQGDVVISQGDEGDYFYTIDEGKCRITRLEDDGKKHVLAELGAGDSFGEEALVSESHRNASVTMLTDGQLMRLAKQDFDELLKTQHLRYIDYATASSLVNDGAVWLDVRTPDEYEDSAFEDSVNLPLASLRGEIPELVFNSSYVICCDTGRRSDSAAFVLSHKGFDVYVLEGGMATLQKPERAGDVAGAAADEVRQLEGLREENAALQKSNAVLGADLENQSRRVSELTAQVEQSRGELGESVEKLGVMFAQIDAYEKERLELHERLAAAQENQQEQLLELQQTLADQQVKNAALEQQSAAEVLRIRSGADRSAQDLQKLATEKQQLTGELTQMRGRVAALESKLQEANASIASAGEHSDDVVKTLREENSSLSERLHAQESQLQDLQERLDAAARSGEDSQSVMDESLQHLKSDLDAANRTIDSLREEIRTVTAAADEAGRQLAGQASARLEGLESEHAQALAAMEHELEQARQAGSELEQQIAQLAADGQAALAESDRVSQSRLAEAAAVQEELSTELSALRQAQEEWEAARSALEQSQETLRQEHEEERASLQQQLESMSVSAEETANELLSRLEHEQQRGLVSERQLADKDGKIAALEQSLVDAGAEKLALEDEAGRLHRRLEEAQATLQQREEHARELELENAATLSKSHEELTRKNENEKALQGQIDRLRKKLEQTSQDSQKTRESSLDDLDTLREELHHERQARAEERAQMAARQRELKEQLAAISTQHEANISDHAGAIEQALEAAREEERSRLQSLQESHAETEERLVRVQAELQKAHEEIAQLDQQEKARRQAEIDAVREQNEQAESAITQLETQLKQLTRERDTALDEQHELRVRMNSLRGEVEVAHGLVTTDGQGHPEDTEALRAELEEARDNIKIAARLRAEAESAREQMAAEVQRLRAQYASDADTNSDTLEPLHVPSLDMTGPVDEQQSGAENLTPLVAEPVVADAHNAGVTDTERRGMHPLGKLVMAVLLLAVCGVTAWLVMGRPDGWMVETGDIITASPVDPAIPGEVSVIPAVTPIDSSRARAATLPGTPADDAPEQLAAASPEKSAATQSTERPVKPGFVGTQPLQLDEPAVPAVTDLNAETAAVPPAPVPDSAPPVGRSFRDSLAGGGKGPAMIELLSATYQMGSGNSLNFDEGPRHTVSLPAFSISEREVTFEDFDRFARATGRRLPFDETWGRGKRPVINVSWHDAVAYTRWLSENTGRKYRLPSEAEWEYAARAGSTYSYWWADTRGTVHANCFDCGSRWDGSQTAPVGSFESNPFGLYDMSGNVQEWTADCYQNSYVGAPADGSARVTADCSQRVVRGGAYSSPMDSLRSANRGQLSQDTRLDNLGFRVVREQ
jgi:formylglycine-generating enzyme required for sulfatase activity/CRP-like cAMP-binding protein/chromosome segregation ATPase